MTPPPLSLVVVRHGQTEWSLSGRHTGRTDLPLTPQGEAMARRLAPALTRIRFTQVLTSPRLRARATCALAGLGARARIDDDLAEWDYGRYEGLRTAEIHLADPHWDVWADGGPDGERPADVAARADRLIARLAGVAGPVALFSHGQFGRALVARWIGLPVAQGRHFALDPASVGILGHDPSHPRRRVVSLWNAAASGGGDITIDAGGLQHVG